MDINSQTDVDILKNPTHLDRIEGKLRLQAIFYAAQWMSITIGEPGKIPGSPINYNLFFIMLKICIETMLFKLKEVMKFILKKNID